MAEATLGYLILCDSHGKVGAKDCILGVFNRIFVGQFPATHPQCFLAFELWAVPGEHKLGFRIYDAEGNDIVPPHEPQEFHVSAEGHGSGAVQLRGLPLNAPGPLRFVLELDGNELGARTLFVDAVPNQPQAPPTSES